MPDIEEIRRRNLAHLTGEEYGAQRRLAERTGLPDSLISRLLKGKVMGSDLARKIEKALELPEGWLDAEYHDLTAPAIDVARDWQDLPAAAQETIRNLINQLKK